MATGPARTGTPPPPPELVPGQRWRRVLPGEERQLADLRRWLTSLLPECPARDDVIAVAAELGNNAVRHTFSGQGGWFAAEVTWHGTVVRVAVADSGAACEPRVTSNPDAEHGRGLLVVRELSLRTGVAGDRRGRLVWADIAWEPSATAPRAAGHDPYEGAIREGQTALAHRFAEVPAWFGRSTLQWWALPRHGGLVTAPTARELASLLYRREASPASPPGPVGGVAAQSSAGPFLRQGQGDGTRARLPGPRGRARVGRQGALRAALRTEAGIADAGFGSGVLAAW